MMGLIARNDHNEFAFGKVEKCSYSQIKKSELASNYTSITFSSELDTIQFTYLHFFQLITN